MTDHVVVTFRAPKILRFSKEKYTKYIKHVTHLGSTGLLMDTVCSCLSCRSSAAPARSCEAHQIFGGVLCPGHKGRAVCFCVADRISTFDDSVQFSCLGPSGRAPAPPPPNPTNQSAVCGFGPHEKRTFVFRLQETARRVGCEGRLMQAWDCRGIVVPDREPCQYLNTNGVATIDLVLSVG